MLFVRAFVCHACDDGACDVSASCTILRTFVRSRDVACAQARHVKSKEVHAMKIITPEEDESVAEFILEITILKKCKHVNITAHYGSWYKGDELFVSDTERRCAAHLCVVCCRLMTLSIVFVDRSSWNSATAALWAIFRLVRLDLVF